MMLAGCGEVITLDRGNLYIEAGTKKLIGRLVRVVSTDPIKDRVIPGDLRFGCCSDVIMRGKYLLIPDDSWFSASIGETFTCATTYEIDYVKGWKNIIRNCLKKCNASFVFSELKEKK